MHRVKFFSGKDLQGLETEANSFLGGLEEVEEVKSRLACIGDTFILCMDISFVDTVSFEFP